MVAVVCQDGVDVDPAELFRYCIDCMPRFAVPRYVRFMDALPRSHAQRVLKPELKAAGAEAPGVWDREAVGYVVQR
jgi:crotonobetaine/carnitine-CoA ligase